jgi:cytidyltransferase-like protein
MPFDWGKPTTQLLGRFQPWHDGHTALFEKALEKTGQVVIMLRTKYQDENNPFSVEERVMQIVEKLAGKGYTTDCFTIITVPNIEHITYGRDVGYTIEQESFEADIENISASNIRKEIQNG